MGCSPRYGECFGWEKPMHGVTMEKGFWIGKTEVTQEAYRHVAGTNPSRYKGVRFPADQVSWRDAQKYCASIGMRLPSGEEW
jgi:formylglycine-generating enzyme required for sulfatase activity